jgi:hypothetical protein
VVVVEPTMLPADAGADVGGKPTANVDVDVVSWCAGEHTPSGTLEEHYRMGLP